MIGAYPVRWCKTIRTSTAASICFILCPALDHDSSHWFPLPSSHQREEPAEANVTHICSIGRQGRTQIELVLISLNSKDCHWET